MPSTYSQNLKIELIATGEQTGLWGVQTNLNLGTALEEAIAGVAAVSMSNANLTLNFINANTTQEFRHLVLNVTSIAALTTTRELIVPTIEKQYLVWNNTTGGQSITVKTSAGTGITVPNGAKMHLVVDGTNVVQAVTDVVGGAIVSTGGTQTLTNKTINGSSNTITNVSLTTGVTGTLPVANGGTGITSLGAGVATFLGTPTSANLAAAVTNETGSGALVFGTNPTISGATVTGGSINNTPIGGTTANTGAFTTVTATTSVTTPSVTRAGTLALSATGANVITASTNGSERMRIDSAGNVGIGTSSPTSALHISGTGGRTITLDGTDIGSIPPSRGQISIGSSGELELYRGSEGGVTNRHIRLRAAANDGQIIFVAGGLTSERMRIDSAGNVLIGKTTATANGGDLQVSSGITFPAAQVAKSDANTLDDYEEGTWTPTVRTSNNVDVTLTTDVGYYTKIGRQVTIHFNVVSSSNLSDNNYYQVQSLPFAVGTGIRDNPNTLGVATSATNAGNANQRSVFSVTGSSFGSALFINASPDYDFQNNDGFSGVAVYYV